MDEMRESKWQEQEERAAGFHSVEHLARRADVAALARLYLDHCMGNVDRETMHAEGAALTERLLAGTPEDIPLRLIDARFLIEEERFHEADWELDQIRDDLENGEEDPRCNSDDLWVFYLYMTTLTAVDEESIRDTYKQIEKICNWQGATWRGRAVLKLLVPGRTVSGEDRLLTPEILFAEGARSPFIYLEAVRLINEEPALLRKLNAFEKQVLHFGARYGLLERDTVERFLSLVKKEKDYSDLLLLILKTIYEDSRDNAVLQEICTLLMKGGRVGERYFPWYEKAVEQQLRITKLYEYYMMSLDITKPHRLPKALLMYFSFQPQLDREHTAYLYEYLLRTRSENREIFLQNLPKMERFALEQVKKGRVDRSLAVLYKEVLVPEKMDKAGLEALADLMFAHRITVDESGVYLKVLVYQKDRMIPAEYRMNGREALVDLYDGSEEVLFEDREGRVYEDVPYDVEDMGLAEHFRETLSDYKRGDIAFDLAELDRAGDVLNEDNIERAMRVAASDEIAVARRRELYRKVWEYLFKTRRMKTLNAELADVPMEILEEQEKSLAVKYLVACGSFDLADEWIEEVGTDLLDKDTRAAWLCDRIERAPGEEDGVLIDAAREAFFEGSRDRAILAYLARYFDGSEEELAGLYTACADAGVECMDLEEHLIGRMLSTGNFVEESGEIFDNYLIDGADVALKVEILERFAEKFFVEREEPKRFMVEGILDRLADGLPVSRTCKLAFLKYYSVEERLAEEVAGSVRFCLTELLDDNIYLNFFDKFTFCEDLFTLYEDRTVVEYRHTPGVRARIRAVILDGKGAEQDSYQGYMREICPGLSCKDLVLFADETAEYDVIEETDEGEKLTKSGRITRVGAGEREPARYSCLNEMLRLRTLDYSEELEEKALLYSSREFMNDRLFRLQ